MNKSLLIALLACVVFTATAKMNMRKEEKAIKADQKEASQLLNDVHDLKHIVKLQDKVKKEEAAVHHTQQQIHHIERQMNGEEEQGLVQNFIVTPEPTDNYMSLLIDFFFNWEGRCWWC